jgi:hypothetical protein
MPKPKREGFLWDIGTSINTIRVNGTHVDKRTGTHVKIEIEIGIGTEIEIGVRIGTGVKTGTGTVGPAPSCSAVVGVGAVTAIGIAAGIEIADIKFPAITTVSAYGSLMKDEATVSYAPQPLFASICIFILQSINHAPLMLEQ